MQFLFSKTLLWFDKQSDQNFLIFWRAKPECPTVELIVMNHCDILPDGWADDDQYRHHMVACLVITFYNVKLKVINKCRPHCAINCQGNMKPYGRNRVSDNSGRHYYSRELSWSWEEGFGFRFWSKTESQSGPAQSRHSFFPFLTFQLRLCYGGFLSIEECGGWKPRHLIIIFRISTHGIIKNQKYLRPIWKQSREQVVSVSAPQSYLQNV